MIEVRYNLNMVPDKGSPIHINVSQNDDKCRTFIFKLYSSDGSWTAPASATATIEGRKDDGKFFSFACTYSNGEVTVIVQQQMVAVAGKVRCKIKLVSGAETIESAPFYFVVNPKSMPVNADMSKSDVVDAVAKATQKIVDQVAENIPKDYVKLNEDVSGLKQELEHIENRIEGEYLKEDGTFEAYEGWSRSEYIDCQNVDVLKVYMPRDGRYIGFYGANREFEYTYLMKEGFNDIAVPVNSYYFVLYESDEYIDKITYRKPDTRYLSNLRKGGNVKQRKNASKIKSINRLGYNTQNKEYPEQSIEAYKAAVKAGFDVLLCDLSYTSDDVAVCFHDFSINRIARNADGTALTETVNVNEHTYNELNQYDYGIYAGNKFAGTKLLTLDQFLAFAKASGVEVYIEIKYMSKRKWAEEAVETVRKHGMLDNVSWASHYRADYGQMWIPSRILQYDKSARVALMTNGNGMTDEYKSAMIGLKTDRNDVFAFNWDGEILSEDDIKWLTANNIAYEVGVIDTKDAVLEYYNRDDIKHVISGIESNKIVAAEVIKENMNIGTTPDKTLTESGKAADAGATGKAIDELKQELDDLHDDYISNMFNVNTEQIWNPYSVVYGGYIRCNGQYVESETSHYFEFDVVEGETYRFSTPDSTQAGGTKAGSANYICPVLADGSYYYSDANAQTWKSTYTVPIGSGIVKIILSNPNSRLSDGYYSISTFAFNSSHPYARRFSNKSADIRKTVNHNRLKALKTENGMLDINHRGMSVYYAPNSLTAFYGSASAGYKFVETDVQRTMDGHFVILHDGTTTSATGTVGSVAEMTLDQVRVLNLKVSSSLIPSTEKIPTLEEALECFHATHITPVIELKKETITTENVHDLIDILEKWGQDYIIISLCHQFQTQSGTYPLLLEEVRSISEDIIIAPTMYDNMSYTLINKIHDAFGVNTIVCMDNDTIVESLSKTNLKNYVDYIHSLGMLAEFGTVNYKQKYEYGKQFGFDFCCTNFLMNNHKVDGQTVIEKVGTYGKGTAKTITITLPSDLTTYKDIIRVRGILESASDITITDGNAYHEYVFSAISPKIIDYQIYARNGSTITISSESDINYWKLAWSVTKALW